MALAALKEELPVVNTTRRFALPDLDTHGYWLLPRLETAFPHLNQRFILGWIRNLLYDNANLFLFQDHGVALFQLTNIYSLAPKPEIIERFVFCEEGHAKEAAEFYAAVTAWAKPQGIEKIWVECMSDVPNELIAKSIGSRIFINEQRFARV